MRRPKSGRSVETYDVPAEHLAFMRRRTAFLLEPSQRFGERQVRDLLANAYAQGVEDAATMLRRHGPVAFEGAPAQQDGWCT